MVGVKVAEKHVRIIGVLVFLHFSENARTNVHEEALPIGRLDEVSRGRVSWGANAA